MGYPSTDQLGDGLLEICCSYTAVSLLGVV
jgi:hypothetical protein